MTAPVRGPRARRARRTRASRTRRTRVPRIHAKSRRWTRPSFAPRRPRGRAGGFATPPRCLCTSYARSLAVRVRPPRAPPGRARPCPRRTRRRRNRRRTSTSTPALSTTSTRRGRERTVPLPCRTRGSRCSSSASLRRRKERRSTRCCDARSNASSPKRPTIASPSRIWSSGSVTPRTSATRSSTSAPRRCARSYGTSRARP